MISFGIFLFIFFEISLKLLSRISEKVIKYVFLDGKEDK